jgi:Flp pilus assembly pilin Flp
MNLIARLRAFVRDASGQDLVEYGMLATLIALIALITLLAVTGSGASIGRLWTGIATSLAAVA